MPTENEVNDNSDNNTNNVPKRPAPPNIPRPEPLSHPNENEQQEL